MLSVVFSDVLTGVTNHSKFSSWNFSLIPIDIFYLHLDIQHFCRETVSEFYAGISCNSSITIITSKWQWSKRVRRGSDLVAWLCVWAVWASPDVICQDLAWLACPVTFAFPPCGPCTLRPDGRWCLQSRQHTNTRASVSTHACAHTDMRTHLHKLSHTDTLLTIKFPFSQQRGGGGKATDRFVTQNNL